MSTDAQRDKTPAETLRWTLAPRWYLWDGGFLALGQTEGIVPPHAHHAIQITMALEGSVAAKGSRGDWSAGRGVIVRHDVKHSFDGKGAAGAMLFVDPEASEGAWLHSGLVEDVTVVPDARIGPCIAELRTFSDRAFESVTVRDFVRHCVLSLCPGTPPPRRLDARVTKVLDAIRAADDLRITIEEAAALAFLSPSRFAHLFKQQVGLPFRRYLLWRKLARAMLAIGREGTIAAGAHAADFADAAHLTRTFHLMFGIPPSVMMRGDFFEIASPFNAPA